jgi:hypothetical protein
MMAIRLNSRLIAGLCGLVVFAVFCAGCTTTPAKSVETSETTPIQTIVSPIITIEKVSPPTQIISTLTTTQTTNPLFQSTERVTLKINSAYKQSKIYTYTPSQGRIFLIVEISVVNNAISKGFDFGDTSLLLTDLKNSEPQLLSKSPNLKVRGGLENPFLYPTTIPQGEMRSGQIVFGVQQNSNSYKLSLTDSSGGILSSITINVD